MSRATLEQDKKKTRAKDGPGAETDRKEREEYGEETDELEDDVPQGGRMSLLAHLNELRRRLTICAVCFLVGVALCLSQAEWFTNLLLSRGENFSFVYIAPAELMMTYVRISLVGGVVIIIPVIIYHIWRFLQPGLKRAEQDLAQDDAGVEQDHQRDGHQDLGCHVRRRDDGGHNQDDQHYIFKVLLQRLGLDQPHAGEGHQHNGGLEDHAEDQHGGNDIADILLH